MKIKTMDALRASRDIIRSLVPKNKRHDEEYIDNIIAQLLLSWVLPMRKK